MIATAADTDGIFLCEAQAWNGFAGIDDLRLGAFDGFDKGGSTRGNAGQQLQKVERSTFTGEQGARSTLQFAEQRIRADMIAFLHVPGDFDTRVDFRKTAVKSVDAANNSGFAHDYRGDAVIAGRYEFGGQVSGTNVFDERSAHIGGDFGIQIQGKFEAGCVVGHEVRRSDQRVEQ